MRTMLLGTVEGEAAVAASNPSWWDTWQQGQCRWAQRRMRWEVLFLFSCWDRRWGIVVFFFFSLVVCLVDFFSPVFCLVELGKGEVWVRIMGIWRRRGRRAWRRRGVKRGRGRRWGWRCTGRWLFRSSNESYVVHVTTKSGIGWEI